MRILYLSQYFPPEMGAPSARVHELSREWVRQGHNVTVLTAFPHHPLGVKDPRDQWRLSRRESRDGIDVVRSYIYAAPNKGTLKRMISYASFMLSAVPIGLLRVRPPEAVIATSPQLLCAVAGYVLARLWRRPFVFEVRDLWPEGLVAVELMKENFFIRALKGVARFLYEHGELIVTVGPGYKRQIVEWYQIPAEKIAVIPNGIDTSLFQPGPRENEIRREFGWGDLFVVMYVGTHGLAHALNRVLEAAALLQDEREVLFVFVGEGAEKDNLKAQAASLGLTNVQFIDQQPKSRIPLFYAACDLGVVTLRKSPLFLETIPSKIFEYWGMVRPILVGIDGDARRLVEESAGGEFVPPEDAEALAAAVRRLCRERERLAEMGRRGREYVLQNYERRVQAERYVALLKGLVSSSVRKD